MAKEAAPFSSATGAILAQKVATTGRRDSATAEQDGNNLVCQA